MVLGLSRLIWARFVEHQNLETVLRCHIAAFGALGGSAGEILYDRMCQRAPNFPRMWATNFP
jgi:transposase